MSTRSVGVTGVLAAASVFLAACGGPRRPETPLRSSPAATSKRVATSNSSPVRMPPSRASSSPTRWIRVSCRTKDEPCLMDLGGVLTLAVGSNEVSVHYGGGEWPPCENPPAIRQGEDARLGMRATVHAEVADDDHFSGADLDTCGSDAYSIETDAAP
jgi:hypothetical protein